MPTAALYSDRVMAEEFLEGAARIVASVRHTGLIHLLCPHSIDTRLAADDSFQLAGGLGIDVFGPTRTAAESKPRCW